MNNETIYVICSEDEPLCAFYDIDDAEIEIKQGYEDGNNFKIEEIKLYKKSN